MNVFISWSGNTSKDFAIAVNSWLKQLMQKVTPWMSDADIDPGDRWSQRISTSLKETNFGIICLTQDNLAAPWVLFEAGALAKAVDSARVVPLLLGVKKTDVASPLSQFQACQADRIGFFKLATILNDELKEQRLDQAILTSLFRKLWPELDRQLKRILPALGSPNTHPPRSERELLDEVLDGVRRLQRTGVSDSASGDASGSAVDWQDYYIQGANLANNLNDPAADLAALKAYSAAIVLAPRDLSANVRARLYAHRGAMLKRLNRLVEAENDIAFAQKWASENAEINDALYHMASIKALTGDKKTAFSLLRRLASRDARWIDLVRTREDYFPGVLKDPAFKRLMRARVKDLDTIIKAANTSKDTGRGERRLPSPQYSDRNRREFAQKERVRIACFNKAQTPLHVANVDFDALIAAMQVFVNTCVVPAWGTPAELFRSTDFVRDAWALVFVDSADSPGALGYHDLTPQGLPLGKVFVRNALEFRRPVSVLASHELVEMLVDPDISRTAAGPDSKSIYALEAADPVEELSFIVNGIPMTDFVYPEYFQPSSKPGSVQFDYLNRIERPFQLLAGGFQIIFRNGKWTPIFGSASKKKRFKHEDHRGTRIERRRSGPLTRAGLLSGSRWVRKKNSKG